MSAAPAVTAPLAGFDLNLLRALDALLRTHNVSGAARALGVGQPAMSKSLARLRADLADPLLVRVGRDMVPTARARELATPLATALAAIAEVTQPVAPFVPAQARAEIVVAMADSAQAVLVVPVIERLRKLAPGLTLVVRSLGPTTQRDGARGEIQLAIIPNFEALGVRRDGMGDFVVRPLYRDAFTIASRARTAPTRWTLASFAKAAHVLVAPLGATHRGFVDDILARHGLTRHIAVVVPSFLEAVQLVARTDLISTLPVTLVERAGHRLSLARPPCELPALEMCVAWHPEHATPAATWVREQFAVCAKEIAGG